MSFGTITNVYAETCTQKYFENLYSNLNISQNATIGKNAYNQNFYQNNTINFGNYEYLKGKLWYVITDTNTNSYYSNIDISQTCSHYTWSSQTGQIMTIYYQNGSSAQINSNSFGFPICDTYNSSGQIYQILQYEPNINTISLSMLVGGSAYSCEVDSNGNYKCPIHNGWNYSGLRWEIALEKQNANIKFGITNQIVNLCNSDTQQIINNQNQNAQQQHNDSNAINNNITNTYNFISSDTIESTTNTDDISNQYDSTSNNNVLNFMLIPINFVNSIITGFGNSCSQVCLGNCSNGGFHDNFNFTFVMPCIDIRSVVGNDIYNTIDSLMCVAMIFAFIRSVVGFAKKALLLEADVSSEVRVF